VTPERVLKGDATRALRIAVPGGVFGGFGLGVGTSPEFAVGERAVIFAAGHGSDLVPVQGYQGKLDVTPDGRVQGTALTLDRVADGVRRAARGRHRPKTSPPVTRLPPPRVRRHRLEVAGQRNSGFAPHER
jgi:hypothetical protein